jgi:hypothetical protein
MKSPNAEFQADNALTSAKTRIFESDLRHRQYVAENW